MMGDETTWSGPFGEAIALEVPADEPHAAETVAWWLLTCPGQAAWSQYILAAVRLRDGMPGFPPPRRRFVGATHEVQLAALAPDPVWTVEALASTAWTNGLPWLQPINVVEQFEATDDEMRRLVSLAAMACVNGALQVEAPSALTIADGRMVVDLAANRPQMREAWLASMVKTLAHFRGEEHAS